MPIAEPFAFALAQMDTLGVAACYIDAQERLQGWNQQYLKLFPEHLGTIHAGWDYLENLRHYFSVNHGATMTPERLDDMVTAAVARHRGQTGPLDFQKRDGRWLRSRVNWLPDGGVIKSWADVTAEVLHTESAVVEALSTLQQALLCYDQDGRFFFANNRASSFFPRLIEHFHAGADFAGHLQLLAGEAADEDDRAALLQLAALSWPFAGEPAPVLAKLRDGRVVQLELMPSRNGGLTSVWTDMTEAHRLLAERSRAEAEATAKSEFLAVMSHEIRTPLNGVLGSISLLDRASMTSADRALLDTARASAEHLLHLLNDILDFSKLEAGRVELDDANFELRRLLEGVVDAVRSRAEAKGLFLDCRLAPELPASLRGDPGRLRQILFNLLGNAVKFTEAGWVRLEAVRAQGSDGEPALEISVADSGIGISDEIRPLLFRHFTQADRSITRRYGGTGLGLAICGQLVALMQGEITVESKPGRGSVFRLRLPLRLGLPSLIDQPVQPGRPVLVPLPALSLLVAEDNPTNQMILGTMLRQLGHQVSIASNGIEACAMLRQGQYDLVLMDMQMPEMDGLAATRVIRAMPEPCAKVPIVAVTANALAGDRERCLAAGMNGFVTKPIEVGSLVAAMQAALDEASTGGANLRQPAWPEAAPAKPTLAPAAAQALGALAQRLKRQAASP